MGGIRLPRGYTADYGASLQDGCSDPHLQTWYTPLHTEPRLVLRAQYNIVEVTVCDFPFGLDYKRIAALTLVCWIIRSWRSRLPCCEDTQGAVWRGAEAPSQQPTPACQPCEEPPWK